MAAASNQEPSTERDDHEPRGSPGSPRASVLIVNPVSGGGKANGREFLRLCRDRGIEPLLVRPGEDIAAVARAAAEGGAEVIGMAGGDGSQGAVAPVAAEHDLLYVCIPAGTRNHFAADLGVDRTDIAGALDAFQKGTERRVDLARVNQRVFVNNASMGLYGKLVQSRAYRDRKFRTAIEMLPELIGPETEPFDLRFTGPDGSSFPNAQLLLVSNDPYEIDWPATPGTRGQMDRGQLGVVVVHMGPPWPRWKEWSTPTFRVDSAEPVEVGLDGEAVIMDPPLLFESWPSALRVRVVAPRAPLSALSRARRLSPPLR
jgi:diacylglycerol kinase family enzyme